MGFESVTSPSKVHQYLYPLFVMCDTEAVTLKFKA